MYTKYVLIAVIAIALLAFIWSKAAPFTFYGFLHKVMGIFSGGKAVPYEGLFKVKLMAWNEAPDSPNKVQWYPNFTSRTQVDSWIADFTTRTAPGRQQSGQKMFTIDIYKLELGGDYISVGTTNL